MLSHRRAPAPAHLRRGASLVELLVALVLAGIVGSAVARSRATSHAASADALARAEARRQLAAGAGAVLATLRGAAPAAGDLLALTDSAIELRITLGASALCAHAPAAIDAPPSATILSAAGSVDGAAAWADAPDAGDLLLVLVRDPVADARWRWYSASIAGAGASVRVPCMGAAGALALRVPLAASMPATVVVGAPVRLLRRGRWSVYRSGRRWYLGWRDTDARGAGLDVVQPVSGPHDLGAGGAGGARRPALAFEVVAREAHDAAREAASASSLGSASLDGASLGHVRVVSLRAHSPAARTDGTPAAESLAVAAAFRNVPPVVPP